MAVLSSSNQTSDRKLKNEMSNVDLPPSVEASASASPNSSMSSSSTPPSSVDWQSRRGHASSKEPRVHDLEAEEDKEGEEEEEVIEVIDLTRPERVGSYPQPDFLSRVPGFDRQMSFELPTLQRLVSRSSESVERSQNRPRRPIEVHEIPDDDDDNDDDDRWDRYGRNTIRIDSEVREVQLDPRHPWAQGPIELITRPMYRGTVRTLESKDQRQLEDVVVVDERPPPVNGVQIESDDEEDHGAEYNRAIKGKNSIAHEFARELQRASEETFRSSVRQRQSPPRARSHSREPRSRSHSFMASASPSPFPVTPSHPTDRSSRSSRIKHRGEHRFSPVARPPSPVPLILRPDTLPSPPAPSSTQAVQVIAKGPSNSPQDARSALLLSSQESDTEQEPRRDAVEERPAPDPSDDNRVLRLRRASEQPPSPPLSKRSSPRRARSHTPEFRSQSYSFLAPPIVFPIPSYTHFNTTSNTTTTTTVTTATASTTTTRSPRSTNRIQRKGEHRFTPIARAPSPVPLIKVKIRSSPS